MLKNITGHYLYKVQRVDLFNDEANVISDEGMDKKQATPFKSWIVNVPF